MSFTLSGQNCKPFYVGMYIKGIFHQFWIYNRVFYSSWTFLKKCFFCWDTKKVLYIQNWWKIPLNNVSSCSRLRILPTYLLRRFPPLHPTRDTSTPPPVWTASTTDQYMTTWTSLLALSYNCSLCLNSWTVSNRRRMYNRSDICRKVEVMNIATFRHTKSWNNPLKLSYGS